MIGRPSDVTKSIVLATLFVSWFGLCATAFAVEPRNVLVVFSDNRLLPANVEVDRGLRDAIVDSAGRPVEMYTEFLDRSHFYGDEYDETETRYLREKYTHRPIDVIVAAGTDAVGFLVRKRAEVFAGKPIVHVGLSTSEVEELGPLPVDVVGVPAVFDFASTIDQALRFHPKATRLLIVTGTHAWDRDAEKQLRQEAPRFASRVTVEFLAGLPTAAVVARLKTLKSDTVVFTPGYFADGDGRFFIPRESVEVMVAASPAPVYGPYETFIGSGVVGGVTPRYAAMGREAAQIVNRLLDGAAPQSLQLPAATPSVLVIDWRQARRWGITDEQLPAGAVVRFREPTFWEAYGRYALIALAVMALQTALIAALWYERGRQRRTAAALEASERRMILAARTARLSNWVWNVDAPRANGAAAAPLPHTPVSKEPEAIDFDHVLEMTHPADRDQLANAVRRAVDDDDELNVEYRVVKPNQLRWFVARGRLEHKGSRVLRGVAIDITQRKLAELQAEQDRAALGLMTRVSLLGQLSASIAHQLNQPLAAILSNAEAAQKMLQRPDVDLEEMRAICDDIVTEDNRASLVIRRLSALYKRGEREVRPVDINELIRETLGLVHTDLLTRHVAVRTQFAASLPPIEGERVQLQQVFMNLIVNASDAMKGSAESERTLSISTAALQDSVIIDVTDTGPGIAGGDLERIFEMFWTTKTAGLGIGLAVCRSITAAHGGTLHVADSGGSGATFRVTLPVHATPISNKPPITAA